MTFKVVELEEGTVCPNWGCSGVIEFPPVEDCTCFKSAPCHRCVDSKLACSECYLEDGSPLSEMATPNDDMIDNDESDEKEKEFRRAMRERWAGPRPARKERGRTEGEQVLDAIDKTLGVAMTPQAMWRLG